VHRYWKGLLGVVAAIVVAFVLTDKPANSAPQGWWSTEGYTTTNSGFNPNETALTVARVPGLKLQRATSPERTAQSAPVMDKGRVFVYDDAGITAYDEVSGDQLWRHDLTRTYDLKDGKLVVSDGRVVVVYNYGSAPYGGTGMEILDAVTGAARGAAQSNNGNVGALLVDDGVVVISGESRWDVDTAAFSLSDARPLWTADFALYQPVAANGRILVRGWKDNVQSSQILDLRTGRVLVTDAWKFYDVLTADGAGAKFYVAWGHSLQSVDATTGKPTWLAAHVYPKYAAISPTRLYVATADHRLIAFDLSTGARVWTKTYTKQLLRPIVAGGVLYETVLGDRMYALDPVDGAPLTTPAFTGVVRPPVVTNGKLYVTSGGTMSVYGR
jgi:hypothetical protein